MPDTLSHRQQTLIRSLYTRHGRKKSGFCICEGIRCCTELFKLDRQKIAFVAATAAAATRLPPPPGVAFFPVTPEELAALSATVQSQGIIAVATAPDFSMEGACDEPFIFALDQIGDPGNFGTMLRTAKAAGLHEVWFTGGSVDPAGDKAIRSALGAQFSLRLRGFANLDALRLHAASLGYENFFLTDPHAGESCFDVAELYDRSVLVIGSEAHGVGAAATGRRVTIPMPGDFESLNAAQAATIILFEHVRRGGGASVRRG